jgi:hypothetical protein
MSSPPFFGGLSAGVRVKSKFRCSKDLRCAATLVKADTTDVDSPLKVSFNESLEPKLSFLKEFVVFGDLFTSILADGGGRSGFGCVSLIGDESGERRNTKR